jgi:hypothetical protein
MKLTLQAASRDGLAAPLQAAGRVNTVAGKPKVVESQKCPSEPEKWAAVGLQLAAIYEPPRIFLSY